MKKTIAVFLLLCLCVGLCACGNDAVNQKPENWDPIAKATATITELLNCTTEDHIKAVMQKGATAEDVFKEFNVIDHWRLNRVNMKIREIKYVETIGGCDRFIVAFDYEDLHTSRIHTELPVTPDETDRQKALDHPAKGGEPGPYDSCHDDYEYLLTVENGRYVVVPESSAIEIWEQGKYWDCRYCSAGKFETAGAVDCVNCVLGWVQDAELDALHKARGDCMGCKFAADGGYELTFWWSCTVCDGFGTMDTIYKDCPWCGGIGYTEYPGGE